MKENEIHEMKIIFNFNVKNFKYFLSTMQLWIYLIITVK